MPVIDASVYVALANHRDAHHAVCRAWFRSAASDGAQFRAPTILLSEVAAAISRGSGNPTLALAVTSQLVDGSLIQLVSVSFELAQFAAEIAAQYRIRGCDAVYLALAATLQDELITLDRQQLDRPAQIVAARSPS